MNLQFRRVQSVAIITALIVCSPQVFAGSYVCRECDGDVNGDGILNSDDYLCVLDALDGNIGWTCPDSLLSNAEILVRADVDCNGVVDFDDEAIAHCRSTGGSLLECCGFECHDNEDCLDGRVCVSNSCGNCPCDADVNDDGVIDVRDYNCAIEAVFIGYNSEACLPGAPNIEVAIERSDLNCSGSMYDRFDDVAWRCIRFLDLGTQSTAEDCCRTYFQDCFDDGDCPAEQSCVGLYCVNEAQPCEVNPTGGLFQSRPQALLEGEYSSEGASCRSSVFSFSMGIYEFRSAFITFHASPNVSGASFAVSATVDRVPSDPVEYSGAGHFCHALRVPSSVIRNNGRGSLVLTVEPESGRVVLSEVELGLEAVPSVYRKSLPDFANLQNCFGPLEMGGECTPSDYDFNGAVDLTDWAIVYDGWDRPR